MIFLSLFFSIFSCNQATNKNTTNFHEVNSSEIVFIFKKVTASKSNDNLEVLGSPIYYSEVFDFNEVELKPNNLTNTDTIIQKIKGDRICLSHAFNKTEKLLFEFKKGDTVVFDYDNGYPHVTISNRKYLKYDTNFLKDINILRPLDDFQFIKKNKRIRNEKEKLLYFKEFDLYTITFEKNLDSLLQHNLISKSVYELQKSANRFYQINVDKKRIGTINSEDLKRDDLIYLKTYRYFLENFVVSKFKLKTEYSNDPLSCNSILAFQAVQNSNIFSSKVKEYLLYTYLTIIAENYSKDDFNNYYKKFKEVVNNPYLNEKIKNNYLLDFEDLKSKTDGVYLTNFGKEKVTLQSVISKYKGRVIFVDFWASWCAPCRASFPYSKKLKSEYKSKDVVFLYISIDSDFEKWEKTSEKEGLTDENSLLAVNYPTASFFKELQMKNIPRYLLFNKDGKLVQKNAPQPNSESIREELNALLK